MARGVYKVNEKERTIYFNNGDVLELDNVIEVDNTGSYLRITTLTDYYVINPQHVIYHHIKGTDKVF
jgi:hypothetical protein